jgi:acetylornithine/succinyldiaminopimelate/putrescine aminotransferase
VPIGAIVASGELAQAFQPGTHASTFGGNPLACHAARTVLEFIEHHQVLERVTEAGDRLDRALSVLKKRQPRIKELRGRGLLRGALLDGDAAPVVHKARENGVLLSVAGGTVVRFAPPYVVTDEELDAGVAALDAALSS